MNKALWTAQGILALTFLVAGASKLVMPADELAADTGLSSGFMRFIAAAEVLGAVGLIAPWFFRIKPWLTPLAAAGLLVIMAGAVVVSVANGDTAPAIFPLAIGVVLGFVVYGRWLRVRRPVEQVIPADLAATRPSAGFSTPFSIADHRAAWEARFDRLEAYLRELQAQRMNGATH